MERRDDHFAQHSPAVAWMQLTDAPGRLAMERSAHRRSHSAPQHPEALSSPPPPAPLPLNTQRRGTSSG